jgi:hypothetical protein
MWMCTWTRPCSGLRRYENAKFDTKFYKFSMFEGTYLCVLSWHIVRTRLGLRSSRMHRKRRNRHHQIHADDNGRIRLSIVVTSWRRSNLGRRTYHTPLTIDSAFTLFFLVAMNLCLDVRLWWKFVDLFCLVGMTYFVWSVWTFVILNLCHEFMNLCVQVVNLWSSEYVNVWTRCVNLSL